jgi:hypothetical protein
MAEMIYYQLPSDPTKKIIDDFARPYIEQGCQIDTCTTYHILSGPHSGHYIAVYGNCTNTGAVLTEDDVSQIPDSQIEMTEWIEDDAAHSRSNDCSVV